MVVKSVVMSRVPVPSWTSSAFSITERGKEKSEVASMHTSLNESTQILALKPVIPPSDNY